MLYQLTSDALADASATLKALRVVSKDGSTLEVGRLLAGLAGQQSVELRSDQTLSRIQSVLEPHGIVVTPAPMHRVISDVLHNWRGRLAVAPTDHVVAALSDYLTADHDVTSRHQYPLHVTASGLILDTNNRAVLLVRHTAMRKWLFPGGHLDPNEVMLDAARRELLEETGLDVSGFASEPFVVDLHTIPANPLKDEPVHWHCDFSYLFAGSVDRTSLRMNKESTGFLWVDSRQMLEEYCQHWESRPHIGDLIEKILNAA